MINRMSNRIDVKLDLKGLFKTDIKTKLHAT